MSLKPLNVTAALVRDTFREAFARKIFWAFFGCSTALILFFIFIMKIDVVQGAVATKNTGWDSMNCRRRVSIPS